MNDTQDKDIRSTLIAMKEAIEKSGGDPIKQLSDYILSEDPLYIPELDGARRKIRFVERDDILTELINEYFK